MPNREPVTNTLPDRRQFLPLDKQDATFAVKQALGMHRPDHVTEVLDATLHGAIAELIASALSDAGYVITIPQRPDPMARRSILSRSRR